MSNKRRQEENLKIEREKKYKQAVKKLRVLPIFIVLSLIATLLAYLCKFGYIHNTDMNGGAGGVEVFFSGFNIFNAAISGNYTLPNSAYGDVAMPFYYYAEQYTSAVGTLTVISLICLFAAILLCLVAVISNKHVFSYIVTLLLTLEFVLLLIVYIKVLQMVNSDILPIYCSGNPACSIRSLAIIPTCFSFVSMCLSSYYSIRYFKICKIR